MDTQGNFFMLPAEAQLEEWRDAGEELRLERRRLGKTADQWKWKLGDWLLAGESNWNERTIKRAAPKIWKEPWGTLKNFRWIAGEFPKGSSRRRDGVSWEHHRIVAALPESKQNEYLDSCKGTTIREFKSRLQAEKQAERERKVLEAIAKGQAADIALDGNRLEIQFSLRDSGVFRLFFETEKVVHEQKTVEAMILWLVMRSANELGWVEKAKAFMKRPAAD